MTDTPTADGPVALITGGGKGMGGAIARELAGRGYRVALMSPSGSAEALAAELGGVGTRGRCEVAADLDRLVQAAMARFGRVDAAVIHAGHPPKGDLLDIADDAWALGNEMMMMPLVRLARALTPGMVARGRGVFLNITTFAAFEPSLLFPVSCAYRAAVGAYTKLFADRYAAQGVRMNALLPGYVDSLAHKAETAAAVPMRRLGTVSEIAKTAAFLLSDDAGYITGQNIRVDGGLTRHV